MDKKWIEKEIERLDKLASRNFMNFQDTGERKYQRTAEKAEDTADVFRIALEALENHNALGHLRGALSSAAAKADEALASKSAGQMRSALKNIISEASTRGLYRPINLEEKET